MFVSLHPEKRITIMEATTTFNSAQIHLLQMFAANRSKRALDELCDVLYKHYSKRMDEKLDNLWDTGVLDQQRLDEINTVDLHQLQ